MASDEPETIEELLAQAVERINTLPVEQRQAHYAKQRAGYVSADLALDRDGAGPDEIVFEAGVEKHLACYIIGERGQRVPYYVLDTDEIVLEPFPEDDEDADISDFVDEPVIPRWQQGLRPFAYGDVWDASTPEQRRRMFMWDIFVALSVLALLKLFGGL